MRPSRRALLGPALTIGALAVWLVLFRPVALGGSATWVVIRGSSMLPALQTGDLVVARAADDYAIGDIVAYRVRAGEIGAGHVVVHRLIGGGDAGFEVRGDNNDAPDPWHPTRTDIVGRAWIVIPGLGRLIAWIVQPIVAAALGAALVVAFVVARPIGRAADPRPGSVDGPRESLGMTD
jgi:signal peptidase I